METILRIDQGTTNSVVSIIRDGQPTVVPDEDGQSIMRSAVGVDDQGNLLVGEAARNQALLAEDRTILSVKRQMGEEIKLPLGEQQLTPQEVSAIILRTLKQRVEKHLGKPVEKAVITVPAFFSENQRAATHEAGELAGLEVVRIINEPTAASLTYQTDAPQEEKLLVYDLGGGTFDVSIVQIAGGVVEVLASHGDTKLGGDDFDQLLLEHVCQRYREQVQDIELLALPAARSRLRQAVERAKCTLSDEFAATISEPFLTEHDAQPLNLEMTIERGEYEQLIEPLLNKTLESVDTALRDAKLLAKDIDKVILVGGSSRTPIVRHLLEEQLGKEPHLEVDPDLCVSMGAAIQGGMISGVDVGPVLVDITPRTLGVRCRGVVHGMFTDRRFSPLIHRNTPLPARKSELYYTVVEGQQQVQVEVYQGENEDVSFNELVGEFTLDGLDEEADANSEIVVRFELDVNGTLNVTAIERATSLEKKLTIDNAVARFRTSNHEEAKQRLAELVGPDVVDPIAAKEVEIVEHSPQVQELLARAQRMASEAPADDAEEILRLMDEIESAAEQHDEDQLTQLSEKLEDIMFYVEDA